MTKEDLAKRLDDGINAFIIQIKSEYKEFDKEPATKGDIAELSRQITYVLCEFKDALIDYLEK